MTFVPFLSTVTHRLGVQKHIQQMKERAKSRLKESEDEPQEVRAINALGIHAYFANDYEIFEQGLNALSEVAITAYENLKINAGHSILEHLVGNASVSIHDPRASVMTVEILESIGLQLTREGSDVVPNRIIRGLTRIGVIAAARQQKATVARVIRVMDTMAVRMVEKGMYDATVKVLLAIEDLSMRCLTKNLSEPVEIAIDLLPRFGAILPSSAFVWNRRKPPRTNTQAAIAIQMLKTMDAIVVKAIECYNSSVLTKAVVTLRAIRRTVERAAPANIRKSGSGQPSVGVRLR